MKNKTILITGGAGSLGQSLAEKLREYEPKSIRILDHSEYFQYEMVEHFKNYEVYRFLVGDIRDLRRLKRAFEGVDIVIHAAALKHVHLCEYNPIEAIRTNVEGSVNVADAALDCGVEKVLGISSDKAVHPINIYGASKLTMEKLFTHSNVYGKTKFSCVRFGNFGGKGSFPERIKKCAETGEPIELTNRFMVRYWIPIIDAVEFSIRCVEMMQGGEIFVPKMEEKHIGRMIKELAPNAEVKMVGSRVGEKVVEKLWVAGYEKAEDKGDYWVIGA